MYYAIFLVSGIDVKTGEKVDLSHTVFDNDDSGVPEVGQVIPYVDYDHDFKPFTRRVRVTDVDFYGDGDTSEDPF